MDFQMIPRRKAQVVFLGKLLVSALLLTILFLRVDRPTFIRAVQSLPLRVFLGCAGLYILGYLISTFRWQRLLLAEGIRLPFGQLILVYFKASFFNLFLPTLIGGDIVRGYSIYRITQGHNASLASILADRLSGFAALVGIAMVALAVGYRQLRDPQAAAMILTVALVFVAMITLLLHNRMKDGASRVFRTVGLTRFQVKFQAMVEALQRYSRHRRILGQAIVLSVLLQSLIIVTYFWIGASLNLGIPMAYFFLYVPLITVAAMLPISVAGLGVRESSAVYFFAKLGVESAAALTMSLIWFSLTLVVSGLGGLAFLLDPYSIKEERV